MTSTLYNSFRSVSLKADGSVNSNGKLFFREPGSGSTTLKSVYADKALTSALTNPVILDASGRPPVIFLDGDYNVKETDKDGVTLAQVSNIQGAGAETQFEAYSNSRTYSLNDIVRFTNGLYYISITSNNQGNAPDASPQNWTQRLDLRVYNEFETYQTNNVVFFTDGILYRSLVEDNLGNTPDSSPTQWESTTADASAALAAANSADTKADNAVAASSSNTDRLNTLSFSGETSSSDATTSTTPRAITDLELSSIPVGVYRFTLGTVFSTTSTSGSSDVAINGSLTGGTFKTGRVCAIRSTTPSFENVVFVDGFSTFGGSNASVTTDFGFNAAIQVDGIVEFTSTGSIDLDWFKVAADSRNTTLNSGAYVQLQRLDP